MNKQQRKQVYIRSYDLIASDIHKYMCATFVQYLFPEDDPYNLLNGAKKATYQRLVETFPEFVNLAPSDIGLIVSRLGGGKNGWFPENNWVSSNAAIKEDRYRETRLTILAFCIAMCG